MNLPGASSGVSYRPSTRTSADLHATACSLARPLVPPGVLLMAGSQELSLDNASVNHRRNAGTVATQGQSQPIERFVHRFGRIHAGGYVQSRVGLLGASSEVSFSDEFASLQIKIHLRGFRWIRLKSQSEPAKAGFRLERRGFNRRSPLVFLGWLPYHLCLRNGYS